MPKISPHTQERIVRIIEGAVKNTVDAHPNVRITPYFGRSVAKRAAGTLSAQWPDVLAASKSSGRKGSHSSGHRSSRGADSTPRDRQSLQESADGGRGLCKLKPFPLRRLTNELSSHIRPLRAAGKDEKADTLIEVMRLLSTLKED